ncbi:MAG: NUDIX domain-containing protein, partial [Brevinematales bacterium]
MVFNPGYKHLPDISSLPGKYYGLLYKNDEICIFNSEGRYSLPEGRPAELEIELPQYIGEMDGLPCLAGGLAGPAGPEGSVFSRIYDLYGKTDAQFFRAACLGYHLTHWMINNRFCGKCGSLMGLHERERARHCEKCGNTVYPRISPAIITAVVRDGKLLMARAARFSNRFYSVLAGFIEPGESAEEALKREVMEETGIGVKNIKYF